MTEDSPLYIVAGSTPVCPAHLEAYIDEPAWIAEPDDYDGWKRAHGAPMTCQRCRGGHHDSGRDPMDARIPREDGHEGRDRDDVGGASGESIARAFESYLRHPSVAE